jgi:hypothetical protein
LGGESSDMKFKYIDGTVLETDDKDNISTELAFKAWGTQEFLKRNKIPFLAVFSKNNQDALKWSIHLEEWKDTEELIKNLNEVFKYMEERGFRKTFRVVEIPK